MRSVFNDTSFDTTFAEQGYVVLRAVLPEEVIERLKSFYKTLSINEGEQFFLSNLLSDIPLRKKIHDELGQILGSVADDILRQFKYVLGTLAIKPSGKNTSFGLHQDWSLVDERKFLSLSMWMPLIDVNENNGCFRLLKGSGRYFYHPRGMNIPFPYQEYIKQISERYMTPVPMQKGDVLIFDHRLVHDSGPNFSEQVRVAAVMAFIPNETTLFHHFRKPETSVIDAYELADDFLIDNNFFAYEHPPASGIMKERMTYQHPTIDFEKFKKLYAEAIL